MNYIELLLKNERLKNELTKYETHLKSLLARIFRDGGHYVGKHGVEQACADADFKIALMNATLDSENLWHKMCVTPSGTIYSPPGLDDWFFDEERMDIIGQNGNDGEHYDDN